MSRIERTIEPMAKHVERIHSALLGDIDIKVAEMHNLMLSLVTPGASPMLQPHRTETMSSGAETLVVDPSEEVIPRPLEMRCKGSEASSKTVGSLPLPGDPPDSRLSSWSSSTAMVALEEEIMNRGLKDDDPADSQRLPSLDLRSASSSTHEAPTLSSESDDDNHTGLPRRHPSTPDIFTPDQLYLPPPALISEGQPTSTSSTVDNSALILSRLSKDEKKPPLIDTEPYSTFHTCHNGESSPTQDEAFRSFILSNSAALFEGY